MAPNILLSDDYRTLTTLCDPLTVGKLQLITRRTQMAETETGQPL